MSEQRNRSWARYVSIGNCDLTRLVWIARRNGMKCIFAYKPNVHFYNEIALYGTRPQRRRDAEPKPWNY